MHRAIQAGDGGSFHLTFVLERTNYRDYIVVKGASTTRLRIYHHFKRPDLVAEWLADAWSAQPPQLRRSVMPFLIAIDQYGPVYSNYTDTPEARHITEFPATYVHEDVPTLDWSFEELLTHEMCHVIDKKAEQAGGRFSDSAGWRAAVAEDGSYITDYARRSSKEDFAESCAAFLLERIGKRLTDVHRSHLQKTIPNRLAYIAGIFTPDNDLVAFPSTPHTATMGMHCPE